MKKTIMAVLLCGGLFVGGTTAYAITNHDVHHQNNVTIGKMDENENYVVNCTGFVDNNHDGYCDNGDNHHTMNQTMAVYHEEEIHDVNCMGFVDNNHDGYCDNGDQHHEEENHLTRSEENTNRHSKSTHHNSENHHHSHH